MAEWLKDVLTCQRRAKVPEAVKLLPDDDDMDDPDVYEPSKKEVKKEVKKEEPKMTNKQAQDERLKDVPRETNWAEELGDLAWKDGEVAFLKGNTHMLRENWKEAEEAYSVACALQPMLLEAHIGLCKAFRKQRKFMRAFSQTRAALAHHQGNEVLQKLRDKIQREYQEDKKVIEQDKRDREKLAKLKVQQMCDEGVLGPKPSEKAGPSKDSFYDKNLNACPGEDQNEEIIRNTVFNPTYEEREEWKNYVLNVYRDLYKNVSPSQVVEGATTSYDSSAASGLKISEGHKHMPRPAGIITPPDFRKHVGFITLQQLKEYNCNKDRMLVSVYGDIFDVSDRPDKYGKDGPYYYFSGNDITYGLASGQDDDTTVNKFYDIFKLEEEEQRDKRLQILCSWIGFYEMEYGMPCGRLQVYENERDLPCPPADDPNCCIM